jgi:hypothetical protein
LWCSRGWWRWWRGGGGPPCFLSTDEAAHKARAAALAAVIAAGIAVVFMAHAALRGLSFAGGREGSGGGGEGVNWAE